MTVKPDGRASRSEKARQRRAKERATDKARHGGRQDSEVERGPSPFRLMAQIMSQQLTALSRTLRPIGITGPMSRILTGLSEAGDATINDLAYHSGLERSYVSRLLDQLTHSGLVERVPDPIDRRQRLVRLTGVGRQRQQQAATLVAHLTTRHLRGLSEDETTQLRRLLERVSESYRLPERK